jgi:hypothetical protein
VVELILGVAVVVDIEEGAVAVNAEGREVVNDNLFPTDVGA